MRSQSTDSILPRACAVKRNLAINNDRHEFIALGILELHDLMIATSQLSPSARFLRVLLDGLVLATIYTETDGFQMLAAGAPSTSTDVPVINCEATDVKSSASSIGTYRGLDFSL